MEPQTEGSVETADRRSRGGGLRLAGAGLASVLALGGATDGGNTARAVVPILVAPAALPGFSTLPAGWPGPVPDLTTPREADVWAMVHAACLRRGIPEQAYAMYRVLWEESRLTPKVRSACGRYFGISQFTRSTFRANVREMRHLGLVWGDEEWSPMNPSQAIEVMAWMWSQGYHDHWGPYRRVVQRIATAQASARLN